MIIIGCILFIAIILLIIYATATLGKTSKIFNLIQDHQSVQNDINNGIIERLVKVEKGLVEVKR
ncbi:MAG: hypothetical protein ACK5NF_03230 [Bacilli bacterium]